MNKNVIIILLVLILPVVVYFFLDKNQAVSTNNVSTNRPEVIKFTSDMCSECQKLDEIFPTVYPKYSKQVSLVKVQVQRRTKENQDLINKYNVTLVPTMVFLKANGKVLLRTEGAMSAQELEKHLKDLTHE